jgi:hypothetical protein
MAGFLTRYLGGRGGEMGAAPWGEAWRLAGGCPGKSIVSALLSMLEIKLSLSRVLPAAVVP